MSGEDGVDFINVYSKGKTEIGRWLSNFSYSPIFTEEGQFNSIEGYWYYLLVPDERFRVLHGFKAKELGRSFGDVERSYSEDVFKDKICKAIDCKLRSRAKDLSEITLPLVHYYEYGTKRVYPTKHNWVIEHIEKRIKKLKEIKK